MKVKLDAVARESETGSASLGQPLPSATSDESWSVEVLWAMRVVASHYSYNSCTDAEKLFQRMLPDSVIAKSFTCGERKCTYVVCYGLAPHFSQQLTKEIQDDGLFRCVVHGDAPKYPSDLVCPYKPARALRPANNNLLTVVRTKAGNNSFVIAAATLWNALPNNIKMYACLATFKARLKTHIF